MKKRAKLILGDKKTTTLYRLGKIKTNDLEIWNQGKQEWYEDIPVGTSQIGTIYKGYFIPFMTGDFRDTKTKSLIVNAMNKPIDELHTMFEKYLNNYLKGA